MDQRTKNSLLKIKHEQILKDRNRIINKTNFGFLQQHAGLRPGRYHLLLGPTSSGKTTVTRSILYDFLKNNPKKTVGIYLTEESVSDYENDYYQIEKSIDDFERMEIVSEKENSNGIFDIAKNKHDLVIFDNLTTSTIYNDKRPHDQSTFLLELKREIESTMSALLVVAHTQKGITINHNSVIYSSNIRGNDTASSIAEFAYILQTIKVESNWYQFITSDKFRGHNGSTPCHLLEYDKEKRCYTTSKAVKYSDFKEVFKLRNKLS